MTFFLPPGIKGLRMPSISNYEIKDLLYRKEHGNMDKMKNELLKITDKVSESLCIALSADFAVD